MIIMHQVYNRSHYATVRCIRSYNLILHWSIISNVTKGLYKGYSTKSKVTPFKLADIGEGIAEVELMKWFIKEGMTRYQ